MVVVDLKTFLIFLFAVRSIYCEKRFVLVKRWPPLKSSDGNIAVLRLKAGSTIELSCTASEKFNLCRWARPNSPSSCSIFGYDNADSARPCPSDDGWSIKKLADDKTCTLTLRSIKEGSDEGKWICDLQSYPTNQDNQYESVEAVTEVKIIQPAKVELKGPSQLPVRLNNEEVFTCTATGQPKPIKLEWTIGDQSFNIIDSRVDNDNTEANEQSRQEQVAALVLPEWNGQQLKCTSIQMDDEGAEVRSSDVRILKTIESRQTAGGAWGPAGDFKIVDRFPAGGQDETPAFLLAPQKRATFYCTSSIPWDVCRWKRPNSDQPCGLLSYDTPEKSCRQIWSDRSTAPGDWIVKKESPTTCSITGIEVDQLDSGEWNCHLQSKPIGSGEHSTYDSDQVYFEVKVIRPSRLMATQFPPEVDTVDGQELQYSVTVTQAFPVPKISWFINTVPVNVRLIEETQPQRDSYGAFSYRMTVGYTAHTEDTGKKLICKSVQTDELTNEVATSLESLLTVKARPPPEQTKGLGVAVIAIIVAVAAFLILALILLFIAFRTGRWCFKQPPNLVYIEKEASRAEQGHIEVQTDSGRGTGTDASTGADFGPEKPRRVDFRNEHEYEPLIERDQHVQGATGTAAAPMVSPVSPEDLKKVDQICDELQSSPDTMTEYNYEGQGSLATSLSSLDTAVSEKDWEATFRALGPVFEAMLATEGDDDDSESDSSEEGEDGTEI